MLIIWGPEKCLSYKYSKQNVLYNALKNVKSWILQTAWCTSACFFLKK